MERTLRYLFTMLWGALPALVLFLCLRPLRAKRLQGKGLYSSIPREAVLALFWMFCGGMAMVTLTPYWVSSSLVDLAHGYRWNVGNYPFFSLGRVNLELGRTFYFSPFAIYNLIGNVVMFTPFGFCAALLRRKFRWWKALLTGICVTLFIECWQLLIDRAFDVDDLLLNTFGVVCGFWLALLFQRIFPKAAAHLQVRPIS